VERIEHHAIAAEHRLLLLAVDAGDAQRAAGQELGREVAERRHDLRLDQLDLLPEVALAGLDLVRLRIAIPGRAAFEYIRNEDVAAREADSREQRVEEL